MIIELIADTIATAATTVGIIIIKQKLFGKKEALWTIPDKYGAYPWLWDEGGRTFTCPKCKDGRDNQKQPRYCECENYPNGHYHFKCSQCRFKCIMRCFNDKGFMK